MMDQNGGERDVKDEGRGRPQFLRGRLGFSGGSSILLNSDLFGADESKFVRGFQSRRPLTAAVFERKANHSEYGRTDR